MTSNKYNKNTIFQPYLEGELRKLNDLIQVHCLFDPDHVKAMQKIPSQINSPFTCEHDTQAEGHKRCKWSKA